MGQKKSPWDYQAESGGLEAGINIIDFYADGKIFRITTDALGIDVVKMFLNEVIFACGNGKKITFTYNDVPVTNNTYLTSAFGVSGL